MNDLGLQHPGITLSKKENTGGVNTAQEGKYGTTSQMKAMCIQPPSRTSNFGNKPITIILFPFYTIFLIKKFSTL